MRISGFQDLARVLGQATENDSLYAINVYTVHLIFILFVPIK